MKKFGGRRNRWVAGLAGGTSGDVSGGGAGGSRAVPGDAGLEVFGVVWIAASSSGCGVESQAGRDAGLRADKGFGADRGLGPTTGISLSRAEWSVQHEATRYTADTRLDSSASGI